MYPALVVDQEKVRDNVEAIVKLCKKNNIDVTGVIKGCNGILEVCDIFIEKGCKSIASSRLEQLNAIKERNINAQTLLLRIPMLSEIDKMIKCCDISLQSELEIIKKINEKCEVENIFHKVILMMDLGDLREGYIQKEELIDTALYIENNLKNIVLGGIGTNLGCYGSIKPSKDNLGKLSELAIEIESKINRSLEIISGGSTSSLPLILSGEIPEKINSLRIGEGILTSRELDEFFGYYLEGTSKDAFTLKAEIVELKNKPTHPIGELFYDAFGNKPEFEDRGNKNRMILAVGRQDFGSHDRLLPITKGIQIIGSSSDHLIVETIDDSHSFKLGDIVEFELFYPALLYLSESPYVKKIIK